MRNGMFGKIIVCVCIAEMIGVQLWAMHIASRTGAEYCGLIRANHAAFGGELLFMCIKRIFASSDSG